jgi:iron(III) transport system permease protein
VTLATPTRPSDAGTDDRPPPHATRSRWWDRKRFWLSRWSGSPIVLLWVVLAAILVAPIALFLAVAFSARLLDQGHAWLSLGGFRGALRGHALRGLFDSFALGVVCAVVATALAFAVAWALQRTTVRGRSLWPLGMWALLLAPSYLVALGWERLLEPGGVLDAVGVPHSWARHQLYGGVGVGVILAAKGLPFAYLAISNALRGLGEEIEDAVRVHGGSRWESMRFVVALLGPAVWSALAIVFAETISDFGVADTLGADAHFPIATYTLFTAIANEPVQFPVAAAVSWLLMAFVVIALVAQSRALRGRSYRVLGGRSRPARRHRLTGVGQLGVTAALGLLFFVCLGVPAVGAVSASVIKGFGNVIGSHSFTLDNYRRVLHAKDLSQPILLSAKLATITATATAVLGVIVARVLATRSAKISARLLDLLLLSAVAMPSIVLAAGYIFAYNLPLTVRDLHIHLYETTTLLTVGYLAAALPATSRVLLGNVAQIHESLREAARVHGSGAFRAWIRAVLPVLALPILTAWLLTFAATLLELPISQLLYAPGQLPLSVSITKHLANYDFGGGTAMEVVAVAFSLLVVGVCLGLFRLLAPAGWRRIGSSS